MSTSLLIVEDEPNFCVDSRCGARRPEPALTAAVSTGGAALALLDEQSPDVCCSISACPTWTASK